MSYEYEIRSEQERAILLGECDHCGEPLPKDWDNPDVCSECGEGPFCDECILLDMHNGGCVAGTIDMRLVRESRRKKKKMQQKKKQERGRRAPLKG